MEQMYWRARQNYGIMIALNVLMVALIQNVIGELIVLLLLNYAVMSMFSCPHSTYHVPHFKRSGLDLPVQTHQSSTQAQEIREVHYEPVHLRQVTSSRVVEKQGTCSIQPNQRSDSLSGELEISPRVETRAEESYAGYASRTDFVHAAPMGSIQVNWNFQPKTIIKRLSGNTMKSGTTWLPLDAQAFQVRKDPDYPLTGVKSPSKPALYSVFACDLVHCGEKIEDPGSFVHWERLLDKTFHGQNVNSPLFRNLPRIVMMNYIFPAFPPNMLSNALDGESFSLITYAELNVDELSSEVEQSGDFVGRAAVERWIGCTFRNEMRALRSHDDNGAKVIVKGTNLSEINFGSFVSYLLDRYNGQPFLLKESHTIYKNKIPGTQDHEYLVINVDMHKFRLLARQGLWGMRETIQKCEADVGVTIEAREFDEFPERILFAVKLLQVNYTESPHFLP
jgi:hypothetical protein